MTEREYGRLVQELAPKSPIWKDCIKAFLVGGFICLLGQIAMNIYQNLGLNEVNAGTAVSMSLVRSACRRGYDLSQRLAAQVLLHSLKYEHKSCSAAVNNSCGFEYGKHIGGVLKRASCLL